MIHYAILIEKHPITIQLMRQIYPDVQPQALPLQKYSSKFKKRSNFT
jgi:hypothetical protein